jgi:GTPase SAR1 family protein
MQQLLQNLWSKPRPLIILGTSKSGKTSLFRQLSNCSLHASTCQISAVGYDRQRISYANRDYEVFDIGRNGVDNGEWLICRKSFLNRDTVVVFVFDCSNWNIYLSIGILREHIQEMIEAGARFCYVVFNKQDLNMDENTAKEIRRVKKIVEEELNRFSDQIVAGLWDVVGSSNGSLATMLLEDIPLVVQENQQFVPRQLPPGSQLALPTSNFVEDSLIPEAYSDHGLWIRAAFELLIQSPIFEIDIKAVADKDIRSTAKLGHEDIYREHR